MFDEGDEYDATRKKFFRASEKKIKPGTFAEHQIADYKQRFSFKTTSNMINAMTRLEMGERYNMQRHYIGRKSVTTALQNMKYEVQTTKKISQASNSNVHWVQARLNFTAQLLVRFGHELPSDLNLDSIKPNSIVDKSLLQTNGLMMSLYQVAWWDEIHIKQRIGEVLDMVYRFAKNKNGIYDKKGEIQKAKPVS